jgi:Aspartyl protease/Tetratricopeptide repeat
MRSRLVVSVVFLAATTSAASQESPATLFARGDFPAASAAYEAVLRAHPDDKTAKLNLAAIRLYENDLGAAEPLLDSLLSVGPTGARVAPLLAELLRRRAEAARGTKIEGRDSRVPFLTDDPLPVVRVIANGRAANFLVDTGADVDLELRFAARIGVKTANAGNDVFVGGRRAPVERGMLASLSLGTATAYDVPVEVMSTHATALLPKLQIEGTVGTTYFERFLVTIDYPNKELILQPRSPQISAAFQAQAAASHAAVIPCYLVGDHFVMANAQVNGAPPGLFVFDSGLASGGIMPSTQLVRAAGISINQAQASTSYGGGGAVTAIPFVARTVSVGAAVQHDVPGIYTPQGSPFELFPFQVWGAISNDFLKHYAYTVDFDAMKIVLEKPLRVSRLLDTGPLRRRARCCSSHDLFDATTNQQPVRRVGRHKA